MIDWLEREKGAEQIAVLGVSIGGAEDHAGWMLGFLERVLAPAG